MSSISYPYSQGDRLEERNTYFYSEYHGAAFFPAWRASRKTALACLPQPQCPTVPKPSQATTSYGYDTAALLAKLLTDEPNQAQNRRLAERLLQRFEVSKRLYCHYDSDFRAVLSSHYDSLELYLLFASLCLHYAKQPASLPFLNGLLKCLDTLISIQQRLSPELGAHLAWLINAEQEWVAHVATQIEVEITQ